MAISFVQTKQNSTGSATSLVITPDAPLTQNNLVVVHVKFATSASFAPSVTDNASTPNTYALAAGPIDAAAGGVRSYQFYGVQTTGGATTITVSWINFVAARITIDEFSGTATSNATVFDKAASNTATTGTSSSVTLTPTYAGELICAGVSLAATSGVTAGTNYTLATNNVNQSTGYRLSGTTSESAPLSWTGSSAWTEIAGAYFPANTTRYFVGNGTDWSSTASWSATSGGSSGASVPTAFDDVLLDANSPGNLTINTSAVCRSLDCTGFVNTLTHSSGMTLSIGANAPGASDIALKLVSGMTYTLGSATTSAISFISTSSTTQIITTGGKTLGNWTVNGVGSSYQLTDSNTTGSTAGVTLIAGTLNTNSQTCSWGGFNANGTTARTITMGSSVITITGSSWSANTGTNFTVIPGTSSITLTAANALFNNGGATGSKTYYDVAFTGGGAMVYSGQNNGGFHDFTATGTASKTDSISIGNTFTVTGALGITGNSATNRLLVFSSILGTQRTITNTGATVTSINADWRDIALTSAVDLSGATGGSGDCGGNTNITFTPSATQTWSGTSGGNWSANAWTSRVPLPQDDVNINSAFSASQTITADMPRLGKSIDFSGATGSPTLALTSTPYSLYGSLTLISGMTLTQTFGIIFEGRGGYTLTSNGKTFGSNVTIQAVGGTLTLQDNLVLSGTLSLSSGTFDANNKNITCGNFTSNTGTRTLAMGTGTWTLTTTSGTIWNISGIATFTGSGSADVVISGTSSSSRTFVSSVQTFGSISYTVAGSAGSLILNGGITVGTFNFSDASNARTLTLTSGITLIVTSAFNVRGTAGKLITINSTTPGSAATLSKANGIVSGDHLSIRDSNATGGATWYAGANSVNVSNNSGWIFSAPPSGGTIYMMGV